MSIERTFTLSVSSGRHKSATQILQNGDYRVGSSWNDDIIFLDDGVQEGHLTLHVEGGAAFVEAHSTGVFLNKEEIACHVRVKTDPPLEVAVGSLVFIVEMQNEPAPPPLPSEAKGDRSFVRVASIGALLLLIGVFVTFRVTGFDLFHKAEVAQVAVASPSPAPTRGDIADGSGRTLLSTLRGRPGRPSDLLKEAADTALSVEQAAAKLRQKAEALKLSHINIEVGAGIISASGAVDPTDEAEWRKAQQWFDSNYGDKITLVSGVEVQIEKPVRAPAIDAIWSGFPPYLVIRGEKYFRGATLDGGWQVSQIDGDKVTLIRNGHPVTFKF